MRLLSGQRLTACGIGRSDTVLAGLSGGADSTALVHALSRCAQEGLIARVCAAHLHHGLRGADADADLAFCRSFCESLNVELMVSRVDAAAEAKARGTGLEAAGRALRYAFLERCAERAGADVIAVAHHRRDQAETVLMHLARGSGMNGLCGMQPRSGRIARPLLWAGRAQIETYLSENGLTYREDASNASPVFTRNRIRAEALPALEAVYPQAERHIAQAAERLSRDEAYLQSCTDALMERVRSGEGYDRAVLCGADEPLRARALMRIAGPRDVTDADVRRIAALLSAQTGTCIELSGSRYAWVDADLLHVGALPEQRAFETPFVRSGVTHTPAGRFIAGPATRFIKPAGGFEAYMDLTALPADVTARTRRPGDRFHPLGAPGSRTLSDYLTDRKVPRFKRDIPLLCAGGDVLFAAGFGIADSVRVTPETTQILHIVFEEGNGA